MHHVQTGGRNTGFGWSEVGILLLLTLLFIGSRDALRKYYERVSHLLAGEAEDRSDQPGE